MFSSKMRRNSFVLIFVCLALLAVCTNIAVVYSQETGIKYDDGSAEDGWTKTRRRLGGFFAVGFAPPYSPLSIDEGMVLHLFSPGYFQGSYMMPHHNAF